MKFSPTQRILLDISERPEKVFKVEYLSSFHSGTKIGLSHNLSVDLE